MDRYYPQSNCRTCLNYIRFTLSEKKNVEPKLAKIWPYIKSVEGMCTHPPTSEPIIVDYIFGDEGNCEIYERGFYREKIGIPCPECRKGELAISHLTINAELTILIGCNRYPECGYSTRHVQLKSLCRFCHVPLVLSTGEILRCSCPQCRRGVDIPGTLRIWPHFSKPDQGCMHLPEKLNCATCKQSRNQRISLMDIEMPMLMNGQARKRMARPNVSRRDSKSLIPPFPRDMEDREPTLGENRYFYVDKSEWSMKEDHETDDGTSYL